MWKILQSMYGQEELSKIEIDDTPAMMVERMAEIIAQKAENGAISVFVIDEVPMMTSRKNFAEKFWRNYNISINKTSDLTPYLK